MLGEILFQKKPRPRDAGRGNDPLRCTLDCNQGGDGIPARLAVADVNRPDEDMCPGASGDERISGTCESSGVTGEQRHPTAAVKEFGGTCEPNAARAPRKSPQDRGHWASAWYFWSSWSLPCCRCRSAGFDEAGALVEAPLGLVKEKHSGGAMARASPRPGHVSAADVVGFGDIQRSSAHASSSELQMRLPASQNRGLA